MPELPFDETLLKATEARYKQIRPNATDSPDELMRTFESLETSPAALETPTPSRLRSARKLLRTNPTDAIQRRLERIGVKPEVAEQACDAITRSADLVMVEGIGMGEGVAEEMPGVERIILRNDLLGVQYLDGGQFAAGTVARVVVRANTAVLGYGTGSMISPRLLMTNNHVLRDAKTAEKSLVEFNYQDDRKGNRLPKVTFRLRPDLFFRSSPQLELDFSIVAVEETSEDSTRLSDFNFNRLGALEGEILAGESVTIIQHPNGDPKQIALRENLVLKFPKSGDQFLHYQTDTTPGSSGSPVFNDQWELVALHHSGYPRRDEAGKILTVDGRIWNKSMGETAIDWIANEGIRARAIHGFLRELRKGKGLTDQERELIDVVLKPAEDEASPARPVGRPGPAAGEVRVADGPGVAAAPVAVAGAVRVMIPLEFTVSLGKAVIIPAQAEPPAPPAAPAQARPPAPAPPPVKPPAPPVAPRKAAAKEADRSDTDAIREAKAELERSATRTYLDEAAEKKARTSYYRGLSSGSDPSAFFDAIKQLLESTHKNRPGYSPSRMLYPWVDLQPDLKIKSIYTGEVFEPLELIELDADVDRARAERMEMLRASEATNDPVALELEEALLESSMPYNCEHTVPQSWFNKREPMRGDLHHLFACESGCNSFRGNVPYFDFSEAAEAVRAGCGRRESDRFQPAGGLGAVARATLYFLLRYSGAIREGRSTYTEDRVAMLVKWHGETPVSEHERHRNQAIHEAQGNRNPLIDHPEWAGKIDFSRGLG